MKNCVRPYTHRDLFHVCHSPRHSNSKDPARRISLGTITTSIRLPSASVTATDGGSGRGQAGCNAGGHARPGGRDVGHADPEEVCCQRHLRANSSAGDGVQSLWI
jgi:hypothetical protein